MPQKLLFSLIPIGVLVFSGTGIVSWFFGANYLDYSPFGSDSKSGQHLGILIVELGVFITVFSTMLAIFYSFAGRSEALPSNLENDK